ncbi:MAG: hypothetical protein ACXAEU_22800 [Candidatus Hodarchaeales archaeon]|jgi:hypothetical protein
MKIIDNSSSHITLEEQGNKFLALLLFILSISCIIFSFWLYNSLDLNYDYVYFIFDYSNVPIVILNLTMFVSVATLFSAYREIRYYIKIDFNGNDETLLIKERGIIISSEKKITKEKIQKFHVSHSSKLSFPYFFSARRDLWIIKLASIDGSEYIIYAIFGLLAERDLMDLYKKMCSLINWDIEETVKEDKTVNCPACEGGIPLNKKYCPFCGSEIPERLGRIKYLD